MSTTPAITTSTVTVDRPVTLRDASKMLGVSYSLLWDMARTKAIRSVRVGRKILIPAWAILALSRGEDCK